ncbi:MAG TPA: hypothetical protein VF788_20305 [Pseudonocardiaceae bacterium]|jgi:hypothetical protein
MATIGVETLTTCGPVVVTSSGDFNVLDATSGKLEVMLVHAVNGGYLKPDSLDHNNHASEARATKNLDNDTINKRGHLWYLTPAIFIDWLQKMTYFIESAASEENDGPDTSKRRRISYHVSNPTGNGIHVGRLDQLPGDYQYKENGTLTPLSQCWTLTLTSCGGLLFAPAIDLNLIWGTLNNSPDMGVCPRPIDNWGGGFQGPNIKNGVWYPKRYQRGGVGERDHH